MNYKNMVHYINTRLNTNGLKLSEQGEKSVQERLNKSERNFVKAIYND